MARRASALATPTATREVLAQFGLSPKKTFGQNFLINDEIVRKILALADVQASDDILEVGPGIGTLTNALATHAQSVIAVERDQDLIPVLEHTMKDADLLQVIIGDALEITADDIVSAQRKLCLNRSTCALPTKLVANLPYAVAATIVLSFFQVFDFLQSATVMVQREVAERMQAKPGTKEYGAYTVKLSLFACVAGSFRVSPANFLPRPHVESTVIRLDRIAVDHESTQVSRKGLIRSACTMADAAFFARRKTIANSCRAYFSSHDPAFVSQVSDLLERAGVDPKMRGEQLSPEEFVRLGQIYRAIVSQSL